MQVSRLLEESYQRVRKLMAERETELRAIADALMKHETISGDDVREIIKSPTNYKLSEQTLATKKLAAKTAAKEEGTKAQSSGVRSSIKPIALNDE